MDERHPYPHGLDFTTLDDELKRVSANMGASEVHGVICGVLCVPGAIENQSWCEEIVPADPDPEQRPALEALLMEVAGAAASALHSDAFEFYPLLPEDEYPIQTRSEALGQWCTGFIFGLTLAGVNSFDALPEDSREVVDDLSRFAGLRSGGAPDEDEEVAYAELIEYVRVGAMLVSQELAGLAMPSESSDALH